MKVEELFSFTKDNYDLQIKLLLKAPTDSQNYNFRKLHKKGNFIRYVK